MGAGHGHKLHYHAHSVIHRLPGQVKILALLGFMLVVVATPATWYLAFAAYLALLLAVIVISTVPLRYLLPRMVVEVPFVVFAVLMPFIATGPKVEVIGISMSQSGIHSAWALLAKGTLGVLAGLTLAATTESQEILRGLEKLRLPNLLVQIMGFMIRYLDLVIDDIRRQHVALTSRGFMGKNPSHWPVLAKAVGALFIRSYERGERVHLAMLSRGYEGTMPRR
ncbi:MAG: cobalt ECF transporter T component CbiQ [Marmoricola sp.]